MAYGEPSLAKEMELMCQICGKEMKSGCNDKSMINYAKQVDPPANPYSQIIPDARYDELEKSKQRKGNTADKKECLHICIPVQSPEKVSPSTSPDQKPEETGTSTKDKAQSGIAGSVMKATCLPTGAGCPQPVKMMLCLPCPPPDAGTSGNAAGNANGNKSDKPTDYTYRCESRELRGGNLYQCCQCNKRNGLQHDCPRTPCQGRPACLTKPWPDCWPSGGGHGIDYTREKGVKRFDPCREQRFDKKDNKQGGGASMCDGNMMVLLCPPPKPDC